MYVLFQYNKYNKLYLFYIKGRPYQSLLWFELSIIISRSDVVQFN